MRSTLNRLLQRLDRWPRRLAALACLLLAVSSALGSSSHGTARTPPLTARLRGSQVAVPVTLSQGLTFVRAGDRVGLYATDTSGGSVRRTGLIADGLLVLRVAAGSDSSAVLVAAGRVAAARIAAATGGQLLAVLDKSP